MTEQEWKKAEDAVHSMFDYTELDVDGYKLTIRLRRAGPYKNVIEIYVNGVFEGRWMVEDCEERRRFLRVSEKSFFTAKELEALGKELHMSKRDFADFKKSHDKKYQVFEYTWLSFKSLKKHLLANNKEIKLLHPL